MSAPEQFFRPAVDQLTPYQPGKPVEDVQRELGLERVVKLASNEGPFPPFPAALEAMERAARDLNRYPDGGAFRLHAALAERHGVPFEQVCAGAGADGCIDMLNQAVLDPGDEIVCGWPSFPSYVIYARKQGATPRLVPLRENRYDLDAMLAAIGPRTKLAYACLPNNPTGTTNTRAELDAFLDAVPDHAHRRRPGLLRVRRRSGLPRRRRGVREAAAAVLIAAHLLEDLRPRRAASRLRGRAGRVCAAIAKARRPFDLTTTAQVAALASSATRRDPRRRASNAAVSLSSARVAARARPRALPGPGGNFVVRRPGEDVARSSSVCFARA